MKNYNVTITAEVISSLPKKDLESMLVASLFDVETELKISDGDNEQFQVVDYKLTEAAPMRESEL